MSLEENKTVASRFLQLWTSGSDTQLEALVSEGFISHQEPSLFAPEAAFSLNEFNELLATYHASCADSKAKALKQIAEGDTVATHWELSATHSGELMGVAPTGKRLAWRGMSMDRIQGGKVVESWVCWDKAGFLGQIGYQG